MKYKNRHKLFCHFRQKINLESKKLRMIGKAAILLWLIALTKGETRTHHNFNQVHQDLTSDHSNDFAQERQGVM